MTTFPNQLRLFKSNILDYSSILPAVVGCRGVFHLACPIPFGHVKNPLEEVIEPATQGTCNVLQACKIANVKRIVHVSSGAAINAKIPQIGLSRNSRHSETTPAEKNTPAADSTRLTEINRHGPNHQCANLRLIEDNNFLDHKI
ncbi:cinnamoyl-CoA reductase CAD2-like [Vicia villosa]|uniref:cinnamoyl-CoA reductase CAD2-like n=1 Tax=Vicia villosa TaxID=3911 RepID=UPI00273AD6D7|nr:cinnamoyl-CoA reductase CAD2-like [Vicia villosa]XP_058785770.1 cinnamoyl-CoA reductase CAD2-like [Vicia villosa]XP_058785771.1 cinnamoyl-CoA reductase CAD2-like [Vicia villosa]